MVLWARGLVCLMLGGVLTAGDARAQNQNRQKVPITDCFEVVPARKLGVLQNDLDCNGPPNVCAVYPTLRCDTDDDCPRASACRIAGNVTLEKNANLDFNGHTISGGWIGIYCTRVRCKIFGPGSVEDTEKSAIWMDGYGRIIDIDVSNAGDHGVRAQGPLVLRDVNIDSTGLDGISLYTNYPVRGLRVTVTNTGLSGEPSFGILAGHVKLDGFTITGNPTTGLSAASCRLKNGLLIDNGTGEGERSDLFCSFRPKLENVICGSSFGFRMMGPNTDWGVCLDD